MSDRRIEFLARALCKAEGGDPELNWQDYEADAKKHIAAYDVLRPTQ